MGRNIGIILLIAAAAALILIAVLMFGLRADDATSSGGATLGFVIFTAVFVLPLAGAGAFFFLRGREESAQLDDVKKQRKLLNIVKAQGQTEISDLVFELDSSLEEVKDMIYDLVGKGLYAGYINWPEGKLYSEQASRLHKLSECKHCGGQVDLAGKGVIRCPYCGTEYFLSQ